MAVLALSGNIIADEYRIEGIPYTSLVVQGEVHWIPVINPKRQTLLERIKRAVEHDDKVSREMLLEGGQEKIIYIGNQTPKWLYLTKDDEWVQETR